jgi:nucleoside-diphosphate-sugar epimerase
MVTGFTGNLSVDIGKARRELGYTPAVGLEQAVAASARWYEANGYL